MNDTPRPRGLLDLPYEIRHRLYELLGLSTPSILYLYEGIGQNNRRYVLGFWNVITVGNRMAKICHTLRDEVLAIVLKVTILDVRLSGRRTCDIFNEGVLFTYWHMIHKICTDCRYVLTAGAMIRNIVALPALRASEVEVRRASDFRLEHGVAQKVWSKTRLGATSGRALTTSNPVSFMLKMCCLRQLITVQL